MRIKDYTDTIRHLTDPFNIPEARRMIQENPALTQEQFKVGGLVEPGVTHYAKVTDAEKKVNREEYLKKTNQTMEDFKEFSKYKRSRINLGQRQGVGTGSGFTLDQMFPKLEKRAIELLNEGLSPLDVSKKLEEEGIIKVKAYARKPRPSGKIEKGLKKSYKPFNTYYQKLLDDKKLKVKKITKTITGTTRTTAETRAIDDAVIEVFKKNPDLQSDRLARIVSTQLGQEISPTNVLNALKRADIDYETKFKKLFPEIKKLDTVVKDNARFLSGNASISEKKKFLFEEFKKAVKDKNFDPGHFANRLKRLGNLYAGTAGDVEKYKTTTKLYKTIKAPANYLDSHLHKNIVGMLSKEVRGIVSKAELLGLSKKNINLLKDLQRGAGELAGDISIHGDHTDIDALMKNFPEYRKNFMRINYIKASLNNLKSGVDTKIFNKFKEAEDLGGDRSPGAIKRRGEIMDEVTELRRAFTAKTGLKIGGFKLDKTGKPSMPFTTERISDIDSPRWVKLKELSSHLGQEPTNVVDQLIIKGKNIKETLTKWKGTPEIANSKFIKSFSRMGGKYGKLTKALIGGTIGSVGIATLATAATPKKEVAEASVVPKIIKENPYTSAAVGTGAALTQKPVRSLLGKTFRTLGTPLAGPAFAAWNVSDKMKEGESLADAIIDPLTGAELALPGMFKENLAKITKNPRLMKLLSLGYKIPKTAMTVGRLTTPVGWGIAGLGALQDSYKDYQRRKEFLTPERKRRAQREYFDRDEPTFAQGGIASLKK